MNFELWSRDEYGQGIILGKYDNIDTLVSRAEKEVNDINVDNALTAGDKLANWEAYFVEFAGEKPRKIYAGVNPDGKHRANVFAKNGVSLDLVTEADNVRIFLGTLDGKRWYAADVQGKEIHNLNHPSLQGKTAFFARPIK